MCEEKILAMILARGGSKGIPRKNIKKMCGKPLIAYTIEAAQESNYIDRIVVSTDDEEIAEISKSYGAEIPFIRPAELATDEATSNDAIYHALNWLKNNENYYPDLFLNLQVTSPLRDKNDIDGAIETFLTKQGNSLISVSKTENSPYWMKKINKKGYLESFLNTDEEYKRRQDLPEVYQHNGAIYLSKTDIFLENKSFYTGKVIPYVMIKPKSVDIDDSLDWKFTEFLMEEKYDKDRL